MSRDDKASYYDLELPDGAVVEAQDVTRALLERAALPPYASKCLGTLLERVWRFGAKPGTDTAREAEKVVTEASFLCEALGGVPSFTLRDVARAAHDAGIEIKFSCDDPAARIADLEGQVERLQRDNKLIGELERERDEARRERDEARDMLEVEHEERKRAEDERDALSQTLATERQAAVATAEELERVRGERDAQAQRATDAEAAFRKERARADALHAELTTTRHDLTALRGTYDAEMDFRAEMRDELGARDDEGFPDFLRRVCAELSDLRARYRPRRQSEEPAPHGRQVLRYDGLGEWKVTWSVELAPGDIWTHHPPAPGEGE